MRIAANVLLAVGVVALFIVCAMLAMVAVGPWWLLYIGVPVGLAAGLVIARRYPPLSAAGIGGFITLGIVLVFVLPGIVFKWLTGDWDSGPNCDGFCMSNTGGFVLALFILGALAVPIAIAGGVMSAIAALATARPVNNA